MRAWYRWTEAARRWVLAAWADRRGATTAEYALLLTLVAVGLISVLTELRAALIEKIRGIIQQLTGA